MSGRIRVTHAGSLIPPPAVLEMQMALRYETTDGLANRAAYPAMVRQAVIDVVQRQADIGIDVVSDGAFGNPGWNNYHYDRISGLVARRIARASTASIGGADRFAFPEFYQEYDRATYWPQLQSSIGKDRLYCVAQIEYIGHEALQACIASMREACDRAGVRTAFMTAVAPGSASFGLTNEYYDDDRELVFAMARALNVEYRAITDAGFGVQLDDSMLTFMFELMVPPASAAEYRAWAELMIEATKVSLDGVPEEKVRHHVCWGAWNGPHVFDVPLGQVVDLLLEIPARELSFAQANPRHEHEWSLWADIPVPPGKVIVPGIIDPLTNIVEHPDLVAQRILRVVSVVGGAEVMAGTDSGFAHWITPTTHEKVMWAKLESLVEGARRASRAMASADGCGRLR